MTVGQRLASLSSIPCCHQSAQSASPLPAPIPRPLLIRLRSQTPSSIGATRAVSAKAPPTTEVTKPAGGTPKGSSANGSYPPLSPEVAADLYRDMFLGREFEEMCAQARLL